MIEIEKNRRICWTHTFSQYIGRIEQNLLLICLQITFNSLRFCLIFAANTPICFYHTSLLTILLFCVCVAIHLYHICCLLLFQIFHSSFLLLYHFYFIFFFQILKIFYHFLIILSLYCLHYNLLIIHLKV